ncbi:Hypothetical predicted protein [Paramuricea clavata]|uniref:Uncharacterized protein n=1 Tax=Paramuricea clavata TaxID=317549 RepID=A0A6S7FVV1_PARCT|nr:Hypothetical predicted protein [Paramuricea clavata]
MNNRTALVPYVHDYIDLERLDRSLLSFIPPFSKMLSEDGGIELEPFQASAFGNCFWCSLSIHLTGNESRQNFLRLASALNAVINAKHFIDKVIQQFTTVDEALQWSETVCCPLNTSKTTIREIVEERYVSEVKETFGYYIFIGLLQVYLASDF